MNRHVHADKIIAKAGNMDLVVFVKAIPWVDPDVPPGSQDLTPRFYVCEDGALPAQADKDYFLCLPQHKEACLHWLNGNMVEVFHNDKWLLVCDSDTHWPSENFFITSETPIRIKPKKEKRWIAISLSRGVSNTLYETLYQAKKDMPFADQYVEIEVEV